MHETHPRGAEVTECMLTSLGDDMETELQEPSEPRKGAGTIVEENELC
jgi:hypothetical protein